MQVSLNQRLAKYSFWLAVLFHLLLILSITLVINVKPAPSQYKPDYTPPYVQSYTASSAATYTPANTTDNQQAKQDKAQKPETTKKTEVSESARKLFLNEQSWYPNQSMLAASKKIIQENQTQETMRDLKNVEPMLMIGDSSQVSDPIIRILARSLSAHFKYPKMEDAFRVTGRVLISMVLHPEGNFTNVYIIQSSNNQDLDNAALYAVNTAPRAIGADRFLKEPKTFVVGFVFGDKRLAS